jgi:hypothetical protein
MGMLKGCEFKRWRDKVRRSKMEMAGCRYEAGPMSVSRLNSGRDRWIAMLGT